jgi:hypothetical protein
MHNSRNWVMNGSSAVSFASPDKTKAAESYSAALFFHPCASCPAISISCFCHPRKRRGCQAFTHLANNKQKSLATTEDSHTMCLPEWRRSLSSPCNVPHRRHPVAGHSPCAFIRTGPFLWAQQFWSSEPTTMLLI